MEENRIIFLGTAGDSIIAGKQARACGGIIVKVGEIQIHLDPGPGTLVKAVQNQINLRGNTAVLVSNSSIINSNDTNAVIDAMTYGGLDKNGILVASQSVVNGTDSEKPVLSEFHKSCLEKIAIAQPGNKIAIEDVEIHIIKAHSLDPTGVGFKILAPRFTLGYTSDTKYEKDVADGFKDCDILIVNVPDPDGEKSEHNLNSSDASRLIGKVNPKLAILTHFGYKMIKADVLNEGRKIQRDTNVQVVMAKDGFTVNPISYSANSNQRRLNAFKEEKEDSSVNEEETKEEQSSEENDS